MIHFSWLSSPVCGTWLWQPWQTNAGCRSWSPGLTLPSLPWHLPSLYPPRWGSPQGQVCGEASGHPGLLGSLNFCPSNRLGSGKPFGAPQVGVSALVANLHVGSMPACITVLLGKLGQWLQTVHWEPRIRLSGLIAEGKKFRPARVGNGFWAHK